VVAGRKHGLVVNGKRALRVMRERQRRFQVSRRKDWGKVEALYPNHVWQSDMTKVWAGPSVGWAYLVSVIDCCTREIVGWDLSLRCRTEEALAALNRAVLEVLPFGSRGTGLTLTTDNINVIAVFVLDTSSRIALDFLQSSLEGR
jgi:putative transposase